MDPVTALQSGRAVLLPTDTVYGLCARAADENAVRAMYELKGRASRQPTALLAAGVEQLLAAVPELDEHVLRALLPGAYTLVLANPARRFAWLAGERPDTIGVRVPVLDDAVAAVLEATGPVAATSANEPGEPPAAALEDVAPRIRAACGAELDGGRLPGTASTVIDFTGDDPVVIREGAAPSADAIARVSR